MNYIFKKNWKLNIYSVFNDEFMIMIDFLIRSSILYTYGFHRIFMTHEKDLLKKGQNSTWEVFYESTCKGDK